MHDTIDSNEYLIRIFTLDGVFRFKSLMGIKVDFNSINEQGGGLAWVMLECCEERLC
jgi:hypothetical protein